MDDQPLTPQELQEVEEIKKLGRAEYRASCPYRAAPMGVLDVCTCKDSIRVFCPSHLEYGGEPFCAYTLEGHRKSRGEILPCPVTLDSYCELSGGPNCRNWRECGLYLRIAEQEQQLVNENRGHVIPDGKNN